MAATGAKVLERWYRDGVAHRDNGPACILYDPKTNDVLNRDWIRDGEWLAVEPPDSLAGRMFASRTDDSVEFE